MFGCVGKEYMEKYGMLKKFEGLLVVIYVWWEIVGID